MSDLLPNHTAVQPLATEEEIRTFLDERITTLGKKNVRFVITCWTGAEDYLLELHAIYKDRKISAFGEVFYLGMACPEYEMPSGEKKGGYCAVRDAGRQITKRLRRDYPMLRCRMGRVGCHIPSAQRILSWCKRPSGRAVFQETVGGST